MSTAPAPSPLSRPFTFDRVVRILGGAALVIGAFYLIDVLSNVLLPFCLACLIAYMLEPLVEANRYFFRLKGRVLASILSLLEVAGAIGMLLYFMVPSVIKEVRELDGLLAGVGKSHTQVPFIPDEIIEPIRQWVYNFKLSDLLHSSHLESLLQSGTSFVSNVIDILLHTLEWLLTFIYVIFIMFDYQSLMAGFKLLVPAKYRPVAGRIGGDIKNSMNRYFRSQALLALCAAILYSIGFSIVGIPLAIVMGVIVGILYMIPYFQYVTLIPIALICLIDSMTGTAQFWGQFGQCLIVYAVSQSICDYVLTPKVMGKAMGLNPAIILLSLSVWGTLLGLIGMIIALPLTTLLLAYYQEFVINRADNTPADRKAGQDALNDISGD
ncbi:MAG: AI-2E family transporter [Paramuribaculum sp.]|nr:AI-2E family transporter [Paramuribaculum sp.]